MASTASLTAGCDTNFVGNVCWGMVSAGTVETGGVTAEVWGGTVEIWGETAERWGAVGRLAPLFCILASRC